MTTQTTQPKSDDEELLDDLRALRAELEAIAYRLGISRATAPKLRLVSGGEDA